jgi:cytoskeletal protein RodZ
MATSPLTTPPSPADAARTETLGRHLKREREIRQLSLEEVAQITRIPLRQLQRLEVDDHGALPGDVFIKGFVRAYAKAVGLDVEGTLERYEADREHRRHGRPLDEERDATPALTGLSGPERGGRFGIAIALVVLLILFTLALSIVLRPRRRTTPIELSQAPAMVLDAASVEGAVAATATA